jgi:acetyl esterase/lipase
MKVTKEMLHEDLQPHFSKTRIMTYLFRFRWWVGFCNFMLRFTKGKDIVGLHCDEVLIPSNDGDWLIRTRIYRPKNHEGVLPAMLYIHGGGYITGNPEMSGLHIKMLVEARPCVVIAPDYSLAFKRPFPAGFNDCYDSLLWAKQNAEQLNIDSSKFIVAGHSAGGGLTAAISLKARTTKEVNIAFQMPIYPMIDDQQPDDEQRYIESPIWNSHSNQLGWNAYLAGLIGDKDKQNIEIPAYAAPARATDLSNLPPTITFVGTLEPFYQETLEYVEKLNQAGVQVAFKEYPGCFHAFDAIVPDAEISQNALKFTVDSYIQFYDQHLAAEP